MSEPKYKTFRDLRIAARESTPAQPPEEKKAAPTSTSTSSISRTTSTPSTSIAPERDFQRVPNSTTRNAVPEGLFRGKSKQVYDYLWSVSRAAIVPSRTVRKSRKEIKAGAGLGSMVTVDAAIEHLEKVGMLRSMSSIGSLRGNEYEVFTYEETSTSISSTSRYTSPTQKVDVLDVLESSTSSTTQVVENKNTYPVPKTFIKTDEKFDDDETAFAGFVGAWHRAATEITGKTPSKADAARWTELAELLITELKIAAGRTTVSNVPAFLTEHLRRRLWKVDKKRATEIAATPEQGSKTGLTEEDKKKCPDCAGTNFWYPDGPEKGVARCTHQKLRPQSTEPSTE